MIERLRTIMLGDISGKAGMGALFLGLSSLVKNLKADFVIANGENAADGFGITASDYLTMKSLGIDVITSGNHIWQKDENSLDRTLSFCNLALYWKLSQLPLYRFLRR